MKMIDTDALRRYDTDYYSSTESSLASQIQELQKAIANLSGKVLGLEEATEGYSIACFIPRDDELKEMQPSAKIDNFLSEVEVTE